MITPLEISVNAAQPAMPLPPLVSFLGSPSSLRIGGVPRAVGSWRIAAVAVAVTYPDGSIVSKAATSVSGTWVATLDGCAKPGAVTGGYTITADGIDERGEAVSGYVLGTGDVVVLDRDGTVTVGETTYYLHLLAAKPDAPKCGDVYADGSALRLYDGTAWVPFAPPVDLTPYATKAEVDKKKADKTVSVAADTSLIDNSLSVIDGSAGGSIAVKFASLDDSSLRFCELLLLNVSADGAVTLSLPPGTYQFADGADEILKGNSHYCFAEYAANCWLVSKSVVAEVSAES